MKEQDHKEINIYLLRKKALLSPTPTFIDIIFYLQKSFENSGIKQFFKKRTVEQIRCESLFVWKEMSSFLPML